jgi:hypothetical protein
MLPNNCTKRKHEYRIHELLPNGQWLNLYFGKKNYPEISKTRCVWRISLCISDTKRQANDWYLRKQNKKVLKIKGRETGKCGIKGLTIAYERIKQFAEMKKDYLIITPLANNRLGIDKILLERKWIPYHLKDGLYYVFKLGGAT